MHSGCRLAKLLRPLAAASHGIFWAYLFGDINHEYLFKHTYVEVEVEVIKPKDLITVNYLHAECMLGFYFILLSTSFGKTTSSSIQNTGNPPFAIMVEPQNSVAKQDI